MTATIDDRVEKIGAFAQTMADLYLSANQKIAILEGLVAPEVTSIFENSYGAHAYDALAHTLLFDVMRDTWAFVLDPSERAPSLCNTWRLLQDEILQATLRERYTTPIPARWLRNDLPAEIRLAIDEERTANEREELSARWQSSLKMLGERVPALVGSDLAERLSKARKKAIAHYDMVRPDGRPPHLYDIAELGLKWDDPAAFLAQVEPLVFTAIEMVTRSNYMLEDFKSMHRLRAADFWSRLQGKGAVNDLAK